MSNDREAVFGDSPGDRDLSGPPPEIASLEFLRLALRGLPVEQRTALELAVVQRMNLQSISTRLNMPESGVRTALREGLLSLRAVLDVVDTTPVVIPHVPDA